MPYQLETSQPSESIAVPQYDRLQQTIWEHFNTMTKQVFAEEIKRAEK